MSNNWINWRFGQWHLHIGPDERYWVRFSKNPYWKNNSYVKWFERY